MCLLIKWWQQNRDKYEDQNNYFRCEDQRKEIRGVYTILFFILACPSNCADCTHADGCTECNVGYYLATDGTCGSKFWQKIIVNNRPESKKKYIV